MQCQIKNFLPVFLTVSFFSSPMPLLAGDFSATCANLLLNGAMLSADCQNGNGKINRSTVNLNQLITNHLGHFQWQIDGGFYGSVQHCFIADAATLNCELGDGRGGWHKDSLNLNTHITNSWGKLVSDIDSSSTSSHRLSQLMTRGTQIINVDNNMPVQLRGVNLGGLFVTEMWMTPMVTSKSDNQPHDNYSLIKTLDNRFGIEKERELLNAYQQTWITKEDLQRIRQRGFNAVRLPIWYGQFYPVDHVSNDTFRWEAFNELDRIINGASSVGLYVILDMHGVVGGQSCSDSTGHSGPDSNEDGTGQPCSGTNDTNRFWSNQSDQGNTQWLWWQIANHYKGNQTIAGYDLINEPRGAHSKLQVWNAYDNLYKTVRSVDPDHIIFMEGAFGGYGQWNWDALPDPATYQWKNVVYEMHEYQWSGTSPEVQNGATRQVDDFKRHQSWNVPGYIGEFNAMTGNAADWADSIKKYDDAGLSWTMWTYKSSNGAVGTLSGHWGWFDVNSRCYTGEIKCWMPNVNSDIFDWIMTDWQQWQTTHAFSENTDFQF